MTPPTAPPDGAGGASWPCQQLSRWVSSFLNTPGWVGAPRQVPSCRRNRVRPSRRLSGAWPPLAHVSHPPGAIWVIYPKLAAIHACVAPAQGWISKGLLERAVLGWAGVHRTSLPPPLLTPSFFHEISARPAKLGDFLKC